MSFKMKRTLEMRRVESAFADYLENEDSIDLLWSDKVGYVFLTINEKTHQSESCEDLHTAPQLCHRLLDDMAITVLMQTKRNHNFSTMDKDEAAQVRAAWKPVIEKLPDYAYEEAAYIDGCSHSRTFWQIMLPLVQPAIITVTIFNFMSVWNEFFMALIFTTSDSMTPVGVGLLQIVNAMKYSGQYGAMFAAVIIVFLPTFLLYLFLSEKIIVGATSGGVKG